MHLRSLCFALLFCSACVANASDEEFAAKSDPLTGCQSLDDRQAFFREHGYLTLPAELGFGLSENTALRIGRVAEYAATKQFLGSNKAYLLPVTAFSGDSWGEREIHAPEELSFITFSPSDREGARISFDENERREIENFARKLRELVNRLVLPNEGKYDFDQVRVTGWMPGANANLRATNTEVSREHWHFDDYAIKELDQIRVLVPLSGDRQGTWIRGALPDDIARQILPGPLGRLVERVLPMTQISPSIQAQIDALDDEGARQLAIGETLIFTGITRFLKFATRENLRPKPTLHALSIFTEPRAVLSAYFTRSAIAR